jgi:DNA-binding LacI/PurR family transcriptional regulator
MLSIRPVLVVGAGDVSDLRAALQSRGCGTMLAPTADQAAEMLRQFRVDAIVAFAARAEELRALAKFRTPVVLVGAAPQPSGEAKCAAFASDRLDSPELARIVMRVLEGERGINAGCGPLAHADAAAYEADHSRRR